MTKPTLRQGVKLRKGVKLADDNSLSARRARASRVPKGIMSTAQKDKKYEDYRKKMYFA